MQKLMTRAEVAAQLRVCLRQVDVLRETGQLLTIKIGRRRLISEEAVKAFIDRQN
jgi:excisionase family DNA binding protein